MLGLIIVDVEMQLTREGCVLFDKSRRTRVVYMKKSRASACDMTLNCESMLANSHVGRAAWTSSLFCCMVVSPSLYRAFVCSGVSCVK